MTAGAFVVSSTPWCRGLFTPEQVAELSGRLGDGLRVVVSADSHRGGRWFDFRVEANGNLELTARFPRSQVVEGAYWLVDNIVPTTTIILAPDATVASVVEA